MLAAPAALAPLARRADPGLEVADAAPLAPLPSALARPEVAVNLHGQGPESHRILLALSPGRLVAFRHPDVPESRPGPVWRRGEHEVTRWCRLLSSAGIPADPSNLDLTAPPHLGPGWLRGATVLHPGASAAARRWPPARWAAVARAERARGREVAVTAGPGEEDLARRVADAAELRPDAVRPGLDLEALAALIGVAGRVASGDTGVAHLAVAVGAPSVTLLGPLPATGWGPPRGRPRHRALRAGSGEGDPHGAVPDRRLLGLSAADVVRALGELPARGDEDAPRASAGRRS